MEDNLLNVSKISIYNWLNSLEKQGICLERREDVEKTQKIYSLTQQLLSNRNGLTPLEGKQMDQLQEIAKSIHLKIEAHSRIIGGLFVFLFVTPCPIFIGVLLGLSAVLLVLSTIILLSLGAAIIYFEKKQVDFESKKEISKIKKEWIVALLLENPTIAPKKTPSLFWKKCQSEITTLKEEKILFTAGGSYRNLSFIQILQERSENKLAIISKNREIIDTLKGIEGEFPIVFPMIQKQLEIGKERNRALENLKNICLKNPTLTPKLPDEIWGKILSRVSTNDLINGNLGLAQ